MGRQKVSFFLAPHSSLLTDFTADRSRRRATGGSDRCGARPASPRGPGRTWSRPGSCTRSNSAGIGTRRAALAAGTADSTARRG